MTSDRFADDRPPPEWLGDVSAGVDAWTQRASRPTRATERSVPLPAVGQDAQAPVAKPRQRRRSRQQPPPEDTAVRVPDADPESVARKILLDQLTGQARSRKELADRLAAKEVPADVASRLLDRFEEVGLIDDEAFARSWIASRQPGKGLARRALAQELRRKGVDDEVAREALDEIDPDDEQQAARALVRKKLRSLSRVDDTTATRRLVGMLARKGYPSGLAFAVVREELAASGRDEPETDGWS